jgi:hypothetical protein
MSTELVIASYMGPRARSCPEAIADPAWYLKQQLRQLETLEHKLDQITIVSNTANVPAEAFLDQLPKYVRDTPVRKIHRSNLGMSYGAFETAIRLSEHDKIILTEDDYVFTTDHFDEYMTTCDWVRCAAVWEWGWRTHGFWGGPTPKQPVAAIFIISALRTVLLAALDHGWFGKPVVSHEEGYEIGCRNQIAFSQAIFQTQFLMTDWLDAYGSAFWDGEKVRWYHRPSARPWTPLERTYVLPLQQAGKRTRIQFLVPPTCEEDPAPPPSRDFYATLNWDGTFTE